ncbi:MAG: VWA domain-containing protein [Myxococcales bacterium]|nr:VWA domain-containing protein [Myxococcales bacterium]
MRRYLALTIWAVGLASCDGVEAVPPSPDRSPPITLSSDAGAFCAEPEAGCPCAMNAEPTPCYVEPHNRADGQLVCGAGTRYCEGGVWGECAHVQTYEITGPLLLTFSSGTCNPCNPDCTATIDRPTAGDLDDTNSSGVEYDPGAGGIRLPPSTTGMPTSPDRDRDGIPDIADDCPDTPGPPEYFGCPPGSRDPGIFHELPFGGPTVVDPCIIDVQVRTVDVYFLIDTTGSMGGEIDNLRTGLTSGTLIPGCSGGIIGAIRCEIPDAWFGVGYFDDIPVSPFGGAGDDVYRNLLSITDNVAAAQAGVNALTLHWGNDWPESQTQALYAVATGQGQGTYLPTGPTCPAGRFGYPCFRPDSIPVVILFTDAPAHNGPSYPPEAGRSIGGGGYRRVGCDSAGWCWAFWQGNASFNPGWIQCTSSTYGTCYYAGQGPYTGVTPTRSWDQVVTALVDRGIKVIGIDSSGNGTLAGANPAVVSDLRALGLATNSVNAAGDPFVFHIPSNGTGLSTAVVEAVRELADYSRLDVSAIAIDNPATPGFDERTFVQNIVAASWGPRGSCQSRSGNRFNGCLPGTDTNFEVSFRNDVVPPAATAQTFTFWIRVLFNDSTIAFEKEVRIVVPPGVPACATVEVGATRVTPNIMFVVDRSGSMDLNFGPGITRWQAAKDAIIGRTGTGADRGVVGELESTVRFGLQTYPGGASACLPLRGTAGSRSMTLNNYTAINAFFRPETASGGTPTHAALRQAYDQIVASPPPDGPPFIVLVTDGEPNGCTTGCTCVGGNARAQVVQEVQRGFTLGIRTFVVSVGTDVATTHLQDVANAGVGAAGAPFWVATNPAGLTSAIREIIGGARSCEMDVSGAIDADVACMGEVRLGTRLLMCNEPATTMSCAGRTGWRRVSSSAIELCGSDCDALLADPDAVLTGQFPCAPITGRYWRTYDATETCAIPPNRPRWGALGWIADLPVGTAITFEIRAAGTLAALDGATPARVRVTSAGPMPPIDVDTILNAAGLTADHPYVRITAVLEGSLDRTSSPVLTEMQLAYTCTPAE